MMEINNKIFKDPVHGYINVPDFFVHELIDNEYFQRLRNIEQTGMRVLYPAAKHDRFSHSLGVFHLGQKAVEALERIKNTSILSKDFSDEDFNRCKILFLIACLLHDIGHAPFSHSLEQQVLDNSKVSKRSGGKQSTIKEELVRLINSAENKLCTICHEGLRDINAAPHEILGSYLIYEKFKSKIKNIENSYEIFRNEDIFDDDMCFIMRMIMGIKYTEWYPCRQLRNCFIELLNGNNFDVDKLDYIVRDTQMSGISNVSVDVERLLGSICVVKKTKFIDKHNLQKDNINKLTITKIINSKTSSDESFIINGNIKGSICIKNGTTLKVLSGSKFECLRGVGQENAEISYIKGNVAKFSASTKIKEDDELLDAESIEGQDEKIVILRGEATGKKFNVYIENAAVDSDFNFKARADIILRFFGDCHIEITGPFKSIGPIQLFSARLFKGCISELEMLGDTLEAEFTQTKEPSANGYIEYSIGFKKQAINVIANVLDARNYLYLWVYAHHKVIYYANFLIPIISKELAKHCGQKTFPSWALDYSDLSKLDDYYIWTAMKAFLCDTGRKNKNEKYCSDLISQLLSRRYYISLYKSLAEFELVFASFTEKQRIQAFNKMFKQVDKSKPLLEKTGRKKEYLAGYINSEGLNEINKEIRDLYGLPNDSTEIFIDEMLFVVTEFKQKLLDTDKVYLDMGNEKLSISQIPLLVNDGHVSNSKNQNKYFYIYYKEDERMENLNKENFKRFMKEALKNYLVK